MSHEQNPLQGKENSTIQKAKIKQIRDLKKPKEASCCGSESSSKKSINQEIACCGPKVIKPLSKRHFIDHMVVGQVNVRDRLIPKVEVQLTSRDLMGSFLARVGYKRDDYEIKPGLYALGSPNAQSQVLVTANYKMSFDALRKELVGENFWILVLDTFGINVWCAAGKGTFGTEEAITQIKAAKLSEIISHKTLIFPQLGAPGVSGFKVTKATGFKVVFGPVRASDVKAFVESGLNATPNMRRVAFTFWDRLVLTPLELYLIIKPLVILFGLLILMEWTQMLLGAISHVLPFVGAAFVGSVLVPLLLPFLPGRAFSIKGLVAGLIYTGCILALSPQLSLWTQLAYGLLLPSISAFAALNFTGASTYTSFSGVKSEMEVAIPLMLGATGVGVLIFIGVLLVGLF
jgi:hypothetical protein